VHAIISNEINLKRTVFYNMNTITYLWGGIILYKIAIVTTVKDPFIRLAQLFTENNYQIRFFNIDEVGQQKSKLSGCDFICLHLEYNDLINQHVISNIKRYSRVPLYIFGKNHSDEEKVKLLNSGSEGYIAIPFSDVELYARIQAVIKYINQLTNRNVKMISFGPIEIDLANHQIKNGDASYHLTNVEYKILSILLDSRDETVTKDRIINYVWDNDKSATDNALGIHITRLRKKLAHDQHIQLIETIWGVGYTWHQVIYV
jgi:DNA-binding response OmpR family regulator